MVVAVVVAAAWGVGVTPVAALVSAVMAYWRVMMAPTFVMLSTLYPWCLCWALPTSWKSCSSACSRPCRQRCRRRRGRAGGHRPSRRRRRRRRQSPRLMVRWVLQLSDGGGTGGSSSWSSRLSHRAFRGFHPSDAMSSGGGGGCGPGPAGTVEFMAGLLGDMSSRVRVGAVGLRSVFGTLHNAGPMLDALPPIAAGSSALDVFYVPVDAP